MLVLDKAVDFGISIHTPQAGSDSITSTALSSKTTFQSTLPKQGVTYGVTADWIADKIFQSTLPKQGVTDW